MSSSSNPSSGEGLFGALRGEAPGAAAQKHYKPAITINDGGGATAALPTPQVQTVAVPQGPSTNSRNSVMTSANSTVYQLTQAQLSPAATPAPSDAATTRRSDFARFFSADSHELGFQPSSKLASEHEATDKKSGPGKIKYQFQVTKLRSWRTGYQRLLVLYEQSFATLDPDTLAVTNQWSYHTLSQWHVEEQHNIIVLHVEHDKLKFNCHSVPRACILSALLECQDAAGLAPNRSITALDAQRWTRHGTHYAVQLYVKPYGLQEVHENGRAVQLYRYTDLRGISLANNNEAAVVLHFAQPAKWRLYQVFSPRGGRSELIPLMQHHCQSLGLQLSMEHSVAVQDWVEQRRNVNIGLVVTSWPVTKATLRPNTSQGIVKRHLVLTNRSWLVERASEGVVSCHKVVSLIAMVRHTDSDQVSFEFSNGSSRTYASPQRDGLIVSILDFASTMGHQIILSNTFSLPLSLAWKWEREKEDVPFEKSGGLFAPIAIPMYCLKRVYTVSTRAYAFVAGTLSDLTSGSVPCMLVVKEIHGVLEACRELNASVPPNGEGLPNGNNEKFISGAIGALWGLIHALLTVQGDAEGADQIGSRVHERKASEDASTVLFATLLRLSSTPTGYQKTAELATFQECIRHIVSIQDVFTKFWAFRVLGALVIGLPGDKRDREAEYVNKSVVLKTGGFSLLKGMVETLTSYGSDAGSDLMQMVTSDLLQSLLCSHYDTTAPESFSALIESLSENYRSLMATLRSPTPFILENTALLLQVISLNAPDAAEKIRDAALSSAMILKYFHGAIFSPVEGYRFLCRYLCSLWFSGPMDCPEKRLLKRMVPHGFLPFLSMPGLSQMEQEQLDQLERDAIEGNIPEGSGNTMESSASGTNTARLRARIAIAHSQPNTKEKKPENYRIFFHVLTQDHSLPDLIWSQQTRRELRVALETEMQYMQREIEARGELRVAWNYQQFSVSYPSLDHEVRVGDVYMRLWLQAGDGFIRSWEDPAGLFELLFRRFLCVVDRDHQVTIMCIRCMHRLYSIHWSKIGPVPDLMILIHSMAKTKSVETQHRLLELAAALLGVNLSRHLGEEADVPDNAEQMLNSESIGQLCQFAAWGHNTGERVESLLSRSVSASSAQAAIDASPAVWFVASASKVPPPAESIRGPFTVLDLKRLTAEDELNPFDLVTASHANEYDQLSTGRTEERHIDTGKWKRLNDVWQLRWLLCMDKADGEGVLTPSEVAIIALKALTRLVELHKSVDSSGAPYIPIPTAKRILSGRDRQVSASNDAGANPLSILAQSLLCSDGRVVEIGANLLHKLLEHNQETMSKLYLSGVFFFALSYPGSNFSFIAKLLECSHLNQNFQSGFKATAGDDNPMRDRSFLGTMLPEGLLFVLVNYGFERFAQIFIGEADTPEVIWTQEMRAHLVEMIRQHLGDFPQRLLQNNTAEYEFCPIPPLAYRKLKNEIFCHNFYLSNLCDEDKFPDWPVAEPVKVFKACLEKFEESIEEDSGGADAVEQAIKLLELKHGDGDKELRQSYRKLARIYHPDKNPGGREMFESIQESYELLLRVVENGEKIQFSSAGVEDGVDGSRVTSSSVDRMRLLVKTQLLICRRYENDMKKMKYPSYKILLGCLQIPVEFLTADYQQHPGTLLLHKWAQPDSCEFVRTGVELVFRTCLISPQNAAEIVVQSGLMILCKLARGTLNLLGAKRLSSDDGAFPLHACKGIVLYSIRTLSGILFFKTGKEALLNAPDTQKLLMDILFDIISNTGTQDDSRDSLDIVQTAMEGLCHLAKDSKCGLIVIKHGLFWPLVRQVLLFDVSVEASTAAKTQMDINNASAAGNTRAKLAVQAVGEICSALIPDSLDVLFTPSISKLLREKRYSEFLHLVNSNIEEAYVIWNSSMRSQLDDLIRAQIDERTQDRGIRSVEAEFRCLKGLQYEALVNEVIIGGVYVRVFNRVGMDALKGVVDLSKFAEALIDFAKARLPGDGTTSVATPEASEDVDMLNLSIRAMKILVHSGLLGDDFFDQCSSLPELVFCLMEFPDETEASGLGCDMGLELSTKQGFADTIARVQCLWRLFLILEAPEDTDGEANNFESTTASNRKRTGWSMLEALSAYGPIASLLYQSSCWLELLGVLCGYHGFTKSFHSRVGAAKALSRMLWDKTTGGELLSFLVRFLPPTLVAMLRDSPELMVKEFDSEVDSPELIWDSSMRAQLRSLLDEQIDKVTEDAELRKSSSFSLDPEVRVVYGKLETEVFVGGVYISRFLKDPTHSLRDPTGFLDSVLKQREQEFGKFWPSHGLMVSRASTEIVAQGSNDSLHDLTTAAVYICKVNDTLCDKLAPWGYCSRSLESIEKALEREMIGAPLIESMRLLHVAANRLVNVDAISSISNTDGTHGIVDFTIKAIGGGPLHPDAAFMVELLYLLFKKALGEVGRISQFCQASAGFNAMPPSPAPGEGPVRHNREKINLGDDPLAMFGLDPTVPLPAPSPVPPAQSTPVTQSVPQYGQFNSPSNMVRPPTQTVYPSAHANHPNVSQDISSPMPRQTVSNMHETWTMNHPLGQSSGPTAVREYHRASPAANIPARPLPSNLYQGPTRNNQTASPQNAPQAPPLRTNQQITYTPSFGNSPQYQQQRLADSTVLHRSLSPNQLGGDPLALQQAQFQQRSSSIPAPPQATPQVQQPYLYQQQQTVPQQTQMHQQHVARQSPQQPTQYQQTHVNPPGTPQNQHQPGSTMSARHQLSSGLPHQIPQRMIADEIYELPHDPSNGVPGPSAPSQLYDSMMGDGSLPRAPPPAAPPPPPPQGDLSHPSAETVPSGGEPQSMTTMAGTGIDARSPTDPAVTAEARAISSDGAEGATTGRVTLLHQALTCHLCEFLVNDFLENVSLHEIKDPAAGKVHAIHLLKLLTMDPGYGMKFKLILKGLPAWSKYKSQDHSLLMATTKRTDYFLTAGEEANSTLLLTHDDAKAGKDEAEENE